MSRVMENKVEPEKSKSRTFNRQPNDVTNPISNEGEKSKSRPISIPSVKVKQEVECAIEMGESISARQGEEACPESAAVESDNEIEMNDGSDLAREVAKLNESLSSQKKASTSSSSESELEDLSNAIELTVTSTNLEENSTKRQEISGKKGEEKSTSSSQEQQEKSIEGSDVTVKSLKGKNSKESDKAVEGTVATEKSSSSKTKSSKDDDKALKGGPVAKKSTEGSSKSLNPNENALKGDDATSKVDEGVNDSTDDIFDNSFGAFNGATDMDMAVEKNNDCNFSDIEMADLSDGSSNEEGIRWLLIFIGN